MKKKENSDALKTRHSSFVPIVKLLLLLIDYFFFFFFVTQAVGKKIKAKLKHNFEGIVDA